MERKYNNLFLEADSAVEHIPASPETGKSNFAQCSHCYRTWHRRHHVLFINNILPFLVSVVLTGKPIQGLLDYVFVFYHHSCQLSTVTAPMTQWYLSFPLLSTPWKLKFGRTFWEAVNCTFPPIGTGSGSLIRASSVVTYVYSKAWSTVS